MTTARRAAGRLFRRLTGDHLVVPDRWLGTNDYVAQSGVRWHEVEPSTPIARRPPVRLGARPGTYDRRVATRFPAMGVLELPDAYLVGRRGWVVTRDRFVLPDHTLLGNFEEMRRDDKPTRIRRLRGVVASLATDHAWWNYGHFLYDGLGRFELLRRAGFGVEGIDWFVCAYPGQKARRLIERLGIPADKIIRVEPGWSVQGDMVLAPTFPGARRDHPRWLIDFLRRELLPEGFEPGPPRRLYVRRTGTRRVANEAQILPVLERYGFESYVPEEDAEPPASFASAEAVVGVHGANLADICFCPEGARVLELTPEDHISSYWYAQAEMAGLEHAYIVCESTGGRSAERARKADVDIRVDPDELGAGLATMLGDQVG